MNVIKAKSTKMPTKASYYLSSFSEDTKSLLKSSSPFASYNKSLKKYEVTEEVLNKVKASEPVLSYRDMTTPEEGFRRVHTEPYGYQEDAVDFSRSHNSLLINFEQGMGKSLTSMKIITARQFQRTLIVCGQANLQEEWMKDAIKHNMADKLSFDIVGGGDSSSSRKTKWLKDKGIEPGVDLINVEALRNDSVLQAIQDRNYQCLIVDEVQAVKGWKALQTKGLHLLPRCEGQVRIALSGTPILNNPLEFFSVLKFLGLLKDTPRTTFEKYYGEWSFDYWGHYVCKGYRHLDDLADLIKPVLCLARKSELHLPTKTRKLVKVPLGESKEEFDHLSTCYRMSSSRLFKHGFKSKAEVRSKMEVLSSEAQGKEEFVCNLLKNGPLLVFSQYTTVLEHYRQRLANNGYRVGYYTGELSMKARLSVLEGWHRGAFDLLLLSINAARYGLNLTEAQQVVFLEPPVSLTVLEQAEDRTHRIGQERPVTSYLLSSTPLDEAALKLMETKQRAIDELWSKV